MHQTNFGYVIEPTDITHRSHKYIEKKRGKNGKWIYYYDKVGVKQRKTLKAMEKRRELSKTMLKKETEQLEFLRSNSKDHKNDPMIESAKEMVDYSANEVNYWNDVVKKYEDEYYNTPLGKIEYLPETVKKAFDSGMDYLKKLFK